MNDNDNGMVTEHSLLHYLIQWGQCDDIIICDIASSCFDRVTEYLLTNIGTKNAIYCALKVVEGEGAEEMVRGYIRHILRSESSVMAISADAKELKGVGLLFLVTEEWRSWLDLENTTTSFGIFRELLNMHTILHRMAKSKLELEVFDYMSLQQFAVEDHLLRNRSFMLEFFNAFCESARHMHAHRITYTALSYRSQRILVDFGWQEMARVIYSIHKVGEDRPFDILRTLGELNAVLFHLELPPVVPYYEMNGFEEYHRQLLERAKFE